MSWQLPTSVTLGGEEYAVHTDYRDILQVMEHMNEEDTQQGALCALYVFYEDFDTVPAALYGEAWQALCDFISCGAPQDDKPAKKLIDWEQDSSMIVAEVNKVAGAEIRALPYMHWFTFMGYFSAVGEGQLSTIVGIRSKKAKGKRLEKWEQEFYKENRKRVDFAKKYSEEESAERAELLRKLKG